MEKKSVKIFGLFLLVGLMLLGSFGVVKAEGVCVGKVTGKCSTWQDYKFFGLLKNGCDRNANDFPIYCKEVREICKEKVCSDFREYQCSQVWDCSWKEKCVSNCVNKECGDDGCVGSCGVCDEGYECSDGQCVGGSSPEGVCSGTPVVNCGQYTESWEGLFSCSPEAPNVCGNINCQEVEYFEGLGTSCDCALTKGCKDLTQTQCGIVPGCSWGEEPVCDTNNLNLCDDTNCDGAGGYWYGDTCNAEEEVVICSAILKEENCLDPCEWYTGGLLWWIQDVCRNIGDVNVCTEGEEICSSENYYVCEANRWIEKGDGKCVGTNWWSCNESNVLVDRGGREGKCGYTCTPDCTGKVCGDNGCGGVCGVCKTLVGESCVNGKCVPSDARTIVVEGCSDSDGGKIYNTSGTCFGKDGLSHTDFCVGNLLSEFYCVKGGNCLVEEYDCGTGYDCSEGKCNYIGDATIIQTRCLGSILKTCESFSADEANCTDYECSFSPALCYGQPDACSNFTNTNNTACESQKNCAWELSPPSPKDVITASLISTSGTCTGTSASCSDFSVNQQTCINQEGCEYNQSLCSGKLNAGVCDDYRNDKETCIFLGCVWDEITLAGGTVGSGENIPLCKPEGANAEIINISVTPGTRIKGQKLTSVDVEPLDKKATGAIINKVMVNVIYYCNPETLLMTETIENGEDCVSDYECVENVCLSGKCTSVSQALKAQAGFLKKIWCFLTSRFSQSNDEYGACMSPE